jgi:CRP-like cAMP-binding protein
MQRSSSTKTGNRLLDAMPAKSLERLRPHLERIELVLGAPVPPAEHIYFPVAGLISVVATIADGTAVEIGMSGREGMFSISAILSEDVPSDVAMVQLAGRAPRIEARLLREEMQAEEAVRTLLMRYTLAFVSAVAQSAACNRLHLLEQRCARWLLACRDRAEGDTFPMTHEFLAMMLGVRRPGVTLAAGSLQENGLITYNHGTMTVLDRQGLERAACECYGIIQREYSRLLRKDA